MQIFSYLTCITILLIVNCKPSHEASSKDTDRHIVFRQLNGVEHSGNAGAALLLPDYKSLSELKSIVSIIYNKDKSKSQGAPNKVTLTYNSRGRKVVSTLESGVSEIDFQNARNGSFWEKVRLALSSPFTMLNKSDLERIEILSRRRDHIYGEGDVAFYDLAETMVHHITMEDKACMDSVLLSEKGYLNTFNHVIAQTFMTTIFSEKLADFVGDVHER